jgi:hypothetical protein
MTEILKTMTVGEAAALWDDPQGIHLQKWAQRFEISLEECHSGHIVTYEKEGLGEVQLRSRMDRNPRPPGSVEGSWRWRGNRVPLYDAFGQGEAYGRRIEQLALAGTSLGEFRGLEPSMPAECPEVPVPSRPCLGKTGNHAPKLDIAPIILTVQYWFHEDTRQHQP